MVVVQHPSSLIRAIEFGENENDDPRLYPGRGGGGPTITPSRTPFSKMLPFTAVPLDDRATPPPSTEHPPRLPAFRVRRTTTTAGYRDFQKVIIGDD